MDGVNGVSVFTKDSVDVWMMHRWVPEHPSTQVYAALALRQHTWRGFENAKQAQETSKVTLLWTATRLRLASVECTM